VSGKTRNQIHQQKDEKEKENKKKSGVERKRKERKNLSNSRIDGLLSVGLVIRLGYTGTLSSGFSCTVQVLLYERYELVL
jgi:hypothetical protein